ncbi:MAG: hypothetical protein ABI369_12370 [Acetobacteraceae bacterium]
MTRRSPSDFERVGIVAGLTAEARIARRLGGLVAVGGGTEAGARAAARRLVNQGVAALISFGLAGGLDPALEAGALIVPDAVRVGGALVATDPDLSRALGGPTVRCLLGADAVASTAEEKQRLWRETGCAALDLESGVVAEVAGGHALAFAVLRAVCDPAAMSLPHAALSALSMEGRIGLARVFGAVAREPGQVPALLRLGRASVRARRTLARQARRSSGPIRSWSRERS